MSPPLPTCPFLGFALLVIVLPPIWLNRVAYSLCIAWELSVYTSMGEVTASAVGMAVDDGLSILIMTLSTSILLGGSFGFRWWGIFTLFLMLKFCADDFSISLYTLDLSPLYSEALFISCSFT